MTEDDVLRQVRAAREAYAELHNFDVRAIVVDLRARDLADDWPVVRRAPRRPRPMVPPNNETRKDTHESEAGKCKEFA